MILRASSQEPGLRGCVGRHALLGIAAALVLAAVTSLYLEPGFVVMVANQLWSCF